MSELFEKGFRQDSVQESLKGKASLGSLKPWPEQALVSFVVLPREKQIFVLDSMVGSLTKPSTEDAVVKMWKILQEIDNNMGAKQWLFATNTQKDVLQPKNSYDSGVSAFLPDLWFLSHLNNVHAFQCNIILELHKSWADLHHHLSRQTIIMLLSIIKGTYFGRALGSPDSNCCVSFKFLHSTISCGERVLGGQDETTSTQFIAQVYSFALLSLWVLALSMLHNLKK